MWVFLLLIVSANGLNLTGEHICHQEERYTVNVTQNVLKNATIRVYVWCLNIPPRCSTFKFKSYNEKQVVEEERIRQVPFCCEGYEPNTAGEKCVPQCKHCVNGVCDDEHKCYCHPGYRGDHCERGCEFARWGRYCRYHCTCERGECDPKNGHCECPSGWTGTRCEQQCLDGYYGLQCKNQCECGEEEMCNPSDGRCLSKDKYLEDMTQSKISKKYNPFGISTLNIRRPSAKPTTSSEKMDTKKLVGVYVLTTTEVVEDLVTTTRGENLIKNVESTTGEKTSHVETDAETSSHFPPSVTKTDNSIDDIVGSDNKSRSDLEPTVATTSNVKIDTEASHKTIEGNDFVTSAKNSTDIPSITTTRQKSNDHNTYVDKSTSHTETVVEPTTGHKSNPMQETSVIVTLLTPKSETGSSVNYDRTTGETSKQLPPTLADVNIIKATTMVHVETSGEVMKKITTVEVTEVYNDVIENDTDAFVEVMKRNVLIEKKSSGDAFTRDKDGFTKSALIGIVSTAITICVLLVGAGLYITARIKEKHRRQIKIKDASTNSSENKEYSFSAKSIFHFPLPDPPDHYNDNTIKRLDSNTTFKSNPGKTTESTYKTSIDYLELFYDQPPSRGTYRAASVPEPPSLKDPEVPQVTVEPIYDEIPSWVDAGPVYANSNQEEEVTKF